MFFETWFYEFKFFETFQKITEKNLILETKRFRVVTIGS